jgi:precorrin-2/cobalt-factor-2 C20-methyltransferase
MVDLSDKLCIEIEMPMTKDKEKLATAHQKGAQQLKEVLEQGKDVAMLTLGDPTVYATYIYLHKAVEALGYETEIINGVPSFCAVAAKLNIPLTERAEQLHVIPASYQIEEALELSGTKVFMKAGSKMAALKQKLVEQEKEGAKIYMVENCGMEQEKCYDKAEDMNDEASYYSIVICKED